MTTWKWVWNFPDWFHSCWLPVILGSPWRVAWVLRELCVIHGTLSCNWKLLKVDNRLYLQNKEVWKRRMKRWVMFLNFLVAWLPLRVLKSMFYTSPRDGAWPLHASDVQAIAVSGLVSSPYATSKCDRWQLSPPFRSINFNKIRNMNQSWSWHFLNPHLPLILQRDCVNCYLRNRWTWFFVHVLLLLNHNLTYLTRNERGDLQHSPLSSQTNQSLGFGLAQRFSPIKWSQSSFRMTICHGRIRSFSKLLICIPCK